MNFNWDSRYFGFKASHILYGIAAIQTINVICYAFFLVNNGYLPAPFLMDKSDTFMDFFSPLFWVIKGGFYSEFHSVYPAINYYFLKLFTLGIAPDFILDARQLRAFSPAIGVTYLVFCVGVVGLVSNLGMWKKVGQGHRPIIFITFLFSMPVLFALERANLIFFGLLFLGLYLNASNDLLKVIFLSILINIKPYFLFFLIPYLNKNEFNWRFALSVCGATL